MARQAACFILLLWCIADVVHAAYPVRMTKTCFSEGEVCRGANAGVSNELPCCDGFTCSGNDPVLGPICEKARAAELYTVSSRSECYASGERCIGAPDFPFVPYKPCCGGMTCTAKDATYGLACEVPVNAPIPSPALQCYPVGQRCAGAPGFPLVPDMPCCGDMTCTAQDSEFGLACELPPRPPVGIPGTCYAAGMLCQSAFGFPTVPALPCCGDMTCTGVIPKYGFSCK
jgi:hypothetical protein